MTGRGSARRMGRPPRDEVAEGERRARIMEVANALFGQRGYAGVSLGDIATAVGVSKAALYHHFPSKDELYTTMLCELFDLIGGYMRAIVTAPESVHVRLRRLAEGIAGIPADADTDQMMRDVAEHLSPEQQRRIAEAHAGIVEPPIALMRDGIARGELRGDAEVLAHAFVHLLEAFSGRVGAEAGYRGRPEVVDAVVGIFLHGAGVGAATLPPPS